jgi:hypothetical protein
MNTETKRTKEQKIEKQCFFLFENPNIRNKKWYITDSYVLFVCLILFLFVCLILFLFVF